MNTVPSAKPQPVLTVSQLTSQVRGLIEPTFHSVAVVGEISNFKPHGGSAHWYFSLKDKGATLACACFRQANSRVKFDIQDGLKVVARGSLEIYPPRGGYQLIITSLEPVGVGSWQLAFEQLKEKLEKENLFDPARKRPIPKVPRTIGIVTSASAAALRDIMTALYRRNKGVRVVLAPTRVQGEGADREIAQAIMDLQSIEDIEVIILARGGGSIEDLWAFNMEAVARAIVASRIPIISGIGHETDVTISDLVADLRAPTPTAAAELVSHGHAELSERWTSLNRLLIVRTEHRIGVAHRALERLNPRNAVARQLERVRRVQALLQGYTERMERVVLTRVSRSEQQVVRLSERVDRAALRHINDRWHKWKRMDERLHGLSPLNVLNRGFAIIRRPDGTVVQDSSQVQPGDTVEAWLRQGKLRLKVEQCTADWKD